jgi:hypothetical protein
MGFDTACIQQKQLLKTCFSASNFITRMMGECDDIKMDYDNCMEQVVETKRKENIALGRERNEKWQQKNKELGLNK